MSPKYDGKDCPATEMPGADTISMKKIDDYTIETVSKKGGKPLVPRSVQIFNLFEQQQDRDSARRWRVVCQQRLSACYADTMRMTLDPFRLLLVSLAGYLNQQQQEVIDYLQEENRVLHEQLGSRRLRLNDDQRRRLAVSAKKLGKRVLHELATIHRLIIEEEPYASSMGAIQCRQRLGGMLNYYYRQAA